MSKKKRKKTRRRRAKPAQGALRNRLLDGILQFQFPAEFRIAAPMFPPDTPEDVEFDSVTVAERVEEPSLPSEPVQSYQMIAELANCLWYLKTKYFKRDWDSEDTGDDDPRARRTLGRLNRGIDSLKEGGFEVHDPTDERYPQGGENMMKPIQFQPTAGLTFEKVTETVTPIIYHNDRLIQRGEVFVAVPKQIPLNVADQASEPESSDVTATAPDESIPGENKQGNLHSELRTPGSSDDSRATSDAFGPSARGEPEPEQSVDTNATDTEKDAETNKN
jgi:hypothetical protein